MKLPQARTTNIVVHDLGNELLVYNLTTNQAYNLNETAKVVFNHCDGATPFAELTTKYHFTNDLIHFALDSLNEKGLLMQNYVSPLNGLSRRAAIKKVGLASVIALPVISMMIAPQAAQAASQTFAAGSRNLNESCNTSTDCNQASGPSCVTVTGQSSTGKACCMNGTNQPVFLTGGDPNGGGSVIYGSQAGCESAVSTQCCSRLATCTCTSNGNGQFSCRSVCQ